MVRAVGFGVRVSQCICFGLPVSVVMSLGTSDVHLLRSKGGQIGLGCLGETSGVVLAVGVLSTRWTLITARYKQISTRCLRLSPRKVSQNLRKSIEKDRQQGIWQYKLIIKELMNRKHKYSTNTTLSDQLQDSDRAQSLEGEKSRRRKTDQFKVRVLQKNLVYCVGFSAEMSAPEVLEQYKYMGQYGHIDKISTNKNSFSNKNQKGPSFSTYISFSNDVEAALAILALNNLVWNQRLIRSCYGTTKYCTFFLKKQECPNRPDCYFLHGLERQNQIDEGMHKPTKQMFDRHLKVAQEVIRLNRSKLISMVKCKPSAETVFPTISEVLEQYDASISTDSKENPESPTKQTSVCSNPTKNQHQISIFSTSTSPDLDSQPLQKYVARLILRTYLKDTAEVRSKLWFVDHKKIDLIEKQSCTKQVKKYLVDHINL